MQTISSKLLRVEKLTDDVFQFDFGLEAPLPFQAGQFFMMQVPAQGEERAVNRSYSIASPPSQQDYFSLCVKLIPGGRGSEYLRSLKVGDAAGFMAPVGHFVLKDSPKNIVMVATGTGLAPFMSMLPTLFERGFAGSIALYFGVRYESDLFYMEQLRAWEAEHENFKLMACLSRPESDWTGCRGRVTEFLQELEMDTQNTKVYICGNGPMVKDVRGMMLEKGLEKTDIHLEQFTTA